MAKKSFADYAADKTWESSGFEPLDDGQFIGKITKAEVKQSKNNDWMMVVHHKVMEGPDKGRLAFFSGMFERNGDWNPWGPKAYFEGLGLELPEFEDMEDSLEALVEEETVIAFSLETKGDFQNFTVEELVEDYEEDEDDEEEEDSESESDNEDDEDDEDESELPTEDELEEMDLEEMEELAEELAVTVKGKATEKKLRKALLEYLQEHAEEDEDEEDEEDEEIDEETSALIEFCSAAGIDEVNEDMDKEEIVEFLTGEGVEFEASDLTKDELKLLKSVGLAEIINEPKKKATKKKATKKASKKVAKKKK